MSFAAVYLSLSAQSPHAFSEPLDHVGALYLAMATITTIGFGDIAARSDAARVAVMLQMVADIAVLAVGTRVAVVTVRATLRSVVETAHPGRADGIGLPWARSASSASGTAPRAEGNGDERQHRILEGFLLLPIFVPGWRSCGSGR
ncbi:MAG: potassium channel family protein [Acidimicrobiales bacterium]